MHDASENLVRRAAVLATVALLALPTACSAATVRVEEEPGSTVVFGSPNKAHLVFAAGPGENNALVIAVAATEGEYLKLQVLDSGATVEPGAKCSGGGAPSAPVTCAIHRPKAPDLQIIGGKVIQPIPNTGWDDDFAVDLGDGANSFDASGVTAGGLSSDQVDMTVTGGPGDDTILTGGGRDTIEPGRGRDSVNTGAEYDRVYATDTADGPDAYDLGTGVGELNYSRRAEPVFFDGRNAGAEGEGDILVSPAPYVVGGSGADRLAGPEPGGETFEGGPGDDVLIGGVGADRLLGGLGDDRLSGGKGDDHLYGGAGRDRLRGGGGADLLDCGPGRDTATADRKDRIRSCETIHGLRRRP